MKVIIVGDFVPQERLIVPIRTKKFRDIFSDDLVSIIKSADYSFVNFEFPIVSNGCKPILKCGPNLKGQPEAVEAIKYAGFNCCTLANNHILDQGDESLLRTKKRLEAAGIKTIGAGANLAEASDILYLEKNTQKIAVINCCEHEFSIATETTPGANPLNPIQQYYKIQEARQNADYILVIVHGGHEHYQLPSPRMKETYRFFVDAGADVVVNHHQHCYSGYELYNGKFIFYGIGNFLFDWGGLRNSIWNEGYMVEINFCPNMNFSIYPYSQCNDEAKVKLLKFDAFDKRLHELNSIINNDSALNGFADSYYKDCHKIIEEFLEPICNKWIVKLRRHSMFPKLVNKRWIPLLSNIVLCESHRDKLASYFRTKLK